MVWPAESQHAQAGKDTTAAEEQAVPASAPSSNAAPEPRPVTAESDASDLTEYLRLETSSAAQHFSAPPNVLPPVCYVCYFLASAKEWCRPERMLLG